MATTEKFQVLCLSLTLALVHRVLGWVWVGWVFGWSAEAGEGWTVGVVVGSRKCTLEMQTWEPNIGILKCWMHPCMEQFRVMCLSLLGAVVQSTLIMHHPCLKHAPFHHHTPVPPFPPLLCP